MCVTLRGKWNLLGCIFCQTKLASCKTNIFYLALTSSMFLIQFLMFSKDFSLQMSYTSIMPCGRKQSTLENSSSNSVIFITQGQNERQCYHRSSVVSCCDGAEPLLPGSVPENMTKLFREDICLIFYVHLYFWQERRHNWHILLTKFAAWLVFLPALLFWFWSLSLHIQKTAL